MTSHEKRIDNDEEQEVRGTNHDPSEPDPSNEAPGRLGSAVSYLKKRPRFLIAGGVGVLLLLVSVWGIRLVPLPGQAVHSKHQKPKPSSKETVAASGDRLLKQDLAPFYIPLSGGETEKMARLSLAVTWAPTTAARFREKEIEIRDRLYHRITELASKGENFRGMALPIRSEAQNILEELLRPNELRVVVTGIFVS